MDKSINIEIIGMNIAKKFWLAKNKTSDLSFDTLCALTLEAAELSAFPVGTFNSNGNRWIELAQAWDELLPGGSFGIFLDVVHRAMWGFPYCWGNPRNEEIVRIVQYEMAREREAFIAWDTYSEFEDAIHVPVNQTTPWLDDIEAYRCSLDHYEYLATRMLYKLRFSKRKYRNERKPCEEAWGEYIRCIGKIVPDSKKWDEAQWANENNIHNEILRLYGIDFRKDVDSYHNFYSMLTFNGYNQLQKIMWDSWHISHVKDMTMALARVIWPKDTEGTIFLMFLVAAREAEQTRVEKGITCDDGTSKDVFTYKPLFNSWLYRWTDENYNGIKGDPRAKEEIKRMLFNVAMFA